MLKPVLGWLAPAGARARLSILIFHRVLPRPDPFFPHEIDASQFDEICGWLAAWFNVLPLDDALRRLQAGQLPPRACAITFDDGYADNHGVALPILERHRLSATFFIATGFLDGGRMWNDTVIEAVRRSSQSQLDLCGVPGTGEGTLSLGGVEQRRVAIHTLIEKLRYLPPLQRREATERLAEVAGVSPPTDLMMTSSQVKAMRRAGMQIGAHTVSHPILASLDAATARQEILGSKETLESLLGERIGLFAYPNGKPGADYSLETVALARAAGFDAALSTAWGAAEITSDPFQIPRFTPWDRSRLRFGLRMAANLRRKTT